MRAHEIVSESLIDQYNKEQREGREDAIFSMCRPFLQQIKNQYRTQVVWRGTYEHAFGEKYFDGMWLYRTNRHRTPRDVNPALHSYIDDYFFKKFGKRYRSQAAFGSGEPGVAVNYGDPYVFMPVGDFAFCWSPVLDDLIEHEDDLLDAIPHNPTIDQIAAVMDRFRYTETNLVHAIRSGHEIMFDCQSYFLIDPKVINVPIR